MSVVVHVGCPKTASTWLQTRVFNSHPELDYWRDVPGFEWVNELVNLHDFEFDAESMRRRHLAARKANSGRIALISLEGLVGDLFTGGWDTCRNADRLLAVLGEAKIIIIIRHQVSMIVSLYKQYIAEGGVGSLEAFLRLAPPSRVRFSLNSLRYDKIAGYYRELFGDDAVYVCLYEKFVESPQAFLGNLLDFIGVSALDIDDKSIRRRENPSLSSASLNIARLSNRFLNSGLNPMSLLPPRPINAGHFNRLLRKADAVLLSRLFPATNPISRDTRERLENYYRDANRALVEEFGLPIEKYGYPV